MTTPQQLADHIATWMKKYAARAHTGSWVIGISGGVDSALCSTLAAITGLPTLCITLPIHQHPAHLTRAQEHIIWLKKRFSNIESLEFDLTQTYDDLALLLPNSPLLTENKAATSSELLKKRLDLTRANTQARLRMLSLYHLAGLNNALVVGTGNKVEDFGVGFFTKYGDGGVDLSPIGDLNKSEVYALSKELGIAPSILKAAPCDGLFEEDHSDEVQLGASYPELERAMEYALQGGTKEGLRGRERTVFEIYEARHRANRHKMDPIPVCVIPSELRPESL